MKQSVKHKAFIFLFLFTFIFIFIGLTFKTAIVYAQKPNQTIEVDMGIMDDFGNILADYKKEFFVINNDHFIYREPPVIDRYTFATANVLKLVTAKGETYRVNYFYTLDSTEAGEVPSPLLMSEMPKKKVTVEKNKVVVSITDDSMREIAESKTMTLDYYWDTYVIPAPKKLTGYGFERLETGKKLVDGKRLPQLVYVYKRGGDDLREPSLIFAHLFKERAVTTVKPEYITPGATMPQTNSATGPVKTPAQEPVTKPSTKPATKPSTKPATKPDTKPDTKAETKPDTKPETKADNELASTNTDTKSSFTQTKPVSSDAAPSTFGEKSVPVASTDSGSDKPQGSVQETDDAPNGIVLGITVFGIAVVSAGFIYSKIKK